MVAFTDQSTNKPTSWEWDFGNGQISPSQNPAAQFTTPGTYTITLIVRNASGTGAIRMTDYITVFPSPSVSFGLNYQLACSPVTVQFTNNSQPGAGSIVSYAWTFGDGGTSNLVTPTHTYTQTGYFNVGLTVTNSNGCSYGQTASRVLRVVGGISPNFAWSSGSCTAPYLVNFLNQTAGPGNLTYNWTLGATATPATSAAPNPANVSYPSAGSVPVKLVVQSDLGCSDSITQSVPVSSTSPVINGPTTGCLNTPLAFSNASIPAPLSSSWTFGDGSTSGQDSTTHAYTTPGIYTVTLTNTYPNCSSSTSISVTVGANPAPVFTASPTVSCKAPLTVQFTDQTSPSLTQWQWDFGDGATSTAQNPSHTYTIAGIFNVKLTGTNAAGCSGTTTMTNLVQIVAPSIIMGEAFGCTNAPVSPAVTINAVDGVQSYAWTAPGATPSSSTAASPTFTYTTQGNYSLTLAVTTNGGCTTSQTISNIVQVGTPTTPSFTFQNPVCGNSFEQFTSTSAPADQWIWQFGDGSLPDTAAGAAGHSYKQFGHFNVTLTLDNFGCQTSTTQSLVVNPPIPKFRYSVNCVANPVLGDNETVSFIDSSKVDGQPLTYAWDFGDGSSTIVNTPPYSAPTHTYTSYGSFRVTLSITDGVCSTYTALNVFLGFVYPSFTPLTTTVCKNAPDTLTFTGTSIPGDSADANYIWVIGSDSNYAGSIFTTSLPAIGTYPVTLLQNDVNGCYYASPPGTIQVTGPAARFTTPAGGCLNSPISFTDNSSPYSATVPIASWNWQFGDGKNMSFTTPPFTHAFADTGSYYAILTVTDISGCTGIDTATIPLQITSPRAAFVNPDSFYCPNTPVTFIDSTQGYGPFTETWNFGDGPGTFSFPTHTYPATNNVTYTVTLTAADKYGCTADTTGKILIRGPVAAFTIADTTAICSPLQTMFTAAGQYYDSLYWEFGDGSTSTLPVTSHFYNTADTFYARLVLQGPGGCLDSATRRVLLLNPYATTTFNFTPKTACDSVIAQFTIVPPGYTNFSLSFGDGQIDSSGNLAPVHAYRRPDTYAPSVTLTDATGCIVGVQDTLLTVLGATPFFTNTPTAFCDTGTVYFVDYSISNDGVQSKTLSFGDGNSLAQSPPLTVPFNTSHFYNTPGNLPATLNIITNNNCTASYTDTIKVFQTPHPIISDSGYLCAGLIQFLGKLVIPDVDSVTWLWKFGNGQSANVQNPLVNSPPGTFPVTLSTSVSFGCSDTTSTTIIVNANPVVKGPAEISTPVGVPVTLPFVYSGEITTYTWTPAANLSCTNCANPSTTLTFDQTYTVMVTDSNNCSDTASILVKTICNEGNYFIPNTFSPNGDGVNDYFYPRGAGLFNIQSMRIFNRWGQLVFLRKNFPANSEQMGWDGTFNHKPAPSDAYVYIVEVICNNAQVIAIHGNVVLVR